MRVRYPRVTTNKTTKAVISFCPKENKNKITQAGSGIFLKNEVKMVIKTLIMVKKKLLFFIISLERIAKKRATMAANVVLDIAISSVRT